MSSLKGLLRLFSPTGVWRNRAWLFCLGIAILPLPALRYLIQDQAELWIAWIVYVVPTSWGIGAAIAIRERLEAESTLLDRALTNARDRIAGIQSGEPNRELDGNTWESFVPKDQLIGKRVAMTTRMAQSLCNEAMANRIPPISTTAQAYASELGIGVRSLRTSQTVALRLGILVTFIGLIGAMREIGNLVLTSPDATDASLKAMGTDLTKAFGASVAGLLATLVIQAFVELVQISQRRAVGKVEVVVATVTHVLSLEQVGKAFRITIDKLGRRLEEHGQKLTDHVFAVRASTTEAVDAVTMNAEAFQKAAAEVGGDNQAMTDLLQRHHSLFEKLMASVDAVGAFERRLSGVIAGTAIYEGRFTVEEGIAACSQSA